MYYYVVRVPGGPSSPHDRWLDTYEVRSSTGQVVNWSRDKEEMKKLANRLNQQAEAERPKPPSFYSSLESSTSTSSTSASSSTATVSLSDEQLSALDERFNQLQTALSQLQRGQDYASQVMDQAVSAGLEHQNWVEQQQESLLDYYKQRVDKPVGDAGNLMEAGTAELMRAQKSAMHTVTSSLAARGLLGSSAAESAYAKIAGETATKIGSLAADTQKQLIQTQAARESAYLQAMNQLLSIPTLQGYAEIATAGANASLFAVPTGGF